MYVPKWFAAGVSLGEEGISGGTVGVDFIGEGVGFSMNVTRTDVDVIKIDYSNMIYFLNSSLPNELKHYLNKELFKDYILIPNSTADNYNDYLSDYIKSGYIDKWYSDGGYIK